jgi:hypothetical protein
MLKAEVVIMWTRFNWLRIGLGVDLLLTWLPEALETSGATINFSRTTLLPEFVSQLEINV